MVTIARGKGYRGVRLLDGGQYYIIGPAYVYDNGTLLFSNSNRSLLPERDRVDYEEARKRSWDGIVNPWGRRVKINSGNWPKEYQRPREL